MKGNLSLTSIASSGRRMVFSVESGPTEVKCLVFMRSSFRRRRKDVWGLQLRGATEWTNPEHLFSSGVVSVADRAPHGPAAGPAIRPQPGRVSRGGRAPFDRGDPLRAVRPIGTRPSHEVKCFALAQAERSSPQPTVIGIGLSPGGVASGAHA